MFGSWRNPEHDDGLAHVKRYRRELCPPSVE